MPLSEIQERLNQIQKLETIAQLTGGVAHDINNLLTVIMGSIDLAIRVSQRVDVPATVQTRLHRHHQTSLGACIRGAQLTQQLLAFARRQPLQPVVQDIRDVLRESVSILQQTLRRDIVVDLAVPDALPLVKLDKSQLSVALMNVFINSRDAMPAGGLITVRARELVPGRPRPIDAPAEGCVEVVITDTGSGIPAAEMAKVLEPFFSTKEVGKGRGLGLSQSYGFCKQSGGTLTLTSIEGVGTTVNFYLPITDEPLSGPVAATATPQSSGRGRGGRILLAEDDPDVASVMSSVLEDAGYRVTRVADAPSALSQLVSYEFDLLFTDVHMPGGQSGVELAQKVSRLYPWMRVLLTSGYSDITDRGVAGGFPSIAKPHSAGELLDAIDRAITGAGAQPDR